MDCKFLSDFSCHRYCIVISIFICLLRVDAAVPDCCTTSYRSFRPCTDAHDDPIWSCSEHTGWDKNKCKVDRIYTVQSQSTVFTTQPEGGSFPLASDVILTCNTTSLQCYSQGDCPSIYWTLNGSLVEDHSHWFTVNETSLTINQFDETKQGRYVCHVNDSSFSLQSHAAEVLLPKFTGWSFDVYDTYTSETQDIIKYSVPPGGDMILECDTIGDPKYTITKWNQATIDSDDIVLPNGNLLIRNFTHSICVSYFCILSVSDIVSKSRQYSLCPKTDVQFEPSLIASPKSQTISYGSDVTLYCLAISNTTISYTWFKNGVPLEITRPYMPQVLILENVTRSSTINCLAFNEFGNDTATAQITVLGKPIVDLRVIDHSISVTIKDRDVLISSTTADSSINMTIQCIVDQSRPNIKYTWYYRGNLNSEERNQLTLTGSSVDEIIGSVQCLVSSIGGTAIGYMRILVKDKPNTPKDLQYTNISYLLYQIQWKPSINYFRDIQYKLQFSFNAHLGGTLIEVSTTETCVIYDAKCFAYSRDDSQSVRLYAYRTRTDTYSDCVDLENGLDTILKLPNPLKLTGMYSTLPEENNSVFLVDFRFDNLSTSYDKYTEYDDYIYSYWYYFGYCCSEDCCDYTPTTNSIISYQPINDVEFQCHQTCYWKIGIFNLSGISWTKCLNFTIPDLIPSKPGQLVNATWTDNSGVHVDIKMMLPASNISCGLLWVIVQCDSFETPYSLESVFDTSLPFEFNMTLDSCWNPCDISFYYNNSVGRSLDSNIITLPGPSKDNIGGFENMRYDKLNHSFINISWTLKDGMECLINVRKFISGITFYLKPTNALENCPDVSDYPSKGTSLQELNKTNLELKLDNTTNTLTIYCVKVMFNLWAGNTDQVYEYYLMTIVNDYSGNTEPTHSTTGKLTGNSYISTSVFVKVLVPGGIVLLLITFVIIVIAVVFLIPKCCKRNKKIDNHELEVIIQ